MMGAVPGNAQDPTVKVLANSTFVLAIFCYIKLVPITAEIQPFAALPAALLVAFFPGPLKRVTAVYVGVLLAALAVSIAGTPENGFGAADALQSFAAVLAPVLIFVAIAGNAQHLSPLALKLSVGIWVFIGFSQAYAPAIQGALGLDSLLSTLISRYSPESLRDWGRGATLLSPEPSYSARTIFLFISATLYFWYRGMLSKRALWTLLSAALFLAFVNESATVAVLLFVFACVLLTWRAVVAFAALAVTLLLFADTDGLRFAQVAMTSYELISGGQITDVLGFTNAFGSMRTISVTVAYTALLSGRFFGGGFGSWTSDFLGEMSRGGIDVGQVKFFTEGLGYFIEVKPYSHFAMLAFELGFVGVLLEAGLLYAAFRASRPDLLAPATHRYVTAVILTSLAFLAFVSPVSAPEFWVALALALHLRGTAGSRIP